MKLFELFNDIDLFESLNNQRLLSFFSKWAGYLPIKSNINFVFYFFKKTIKVKKEKNPGNTDISRKYSAVLNFNSLEQAKEFLIELKSMFGNEYDIFIDQNILKEDLRDWFKQKWVDVSRKEGGKHPPCGASAGKKKRGKFGKRAYPKCVPAAKAKSMSASDKKKATERKRRSMRKHRGKSPTYTKTS